MAQPKDGKLALNSTFKIIPFLVFSSICLLIAFQCMRYIHYIASNEQSQISSPFFVNFEVTGLLEIFLFLLLGFLCVKWLRLTHVSEFGTNLWTMVSLTFGLNALTYLVSRFADVPRMLSYYIYWSMSNPLWVPWYLSEDCLRIVFGLTLLRIVSYKITENKNGKRFLELMIVCLASYGLWGIVIVIDNLMSLFLYITSYSAQQSYIIFFVINMVTTGLEHITFFLVSIDVFRKKTLSFHTICIAIFAIGVAWLIKYVAAVPLLIYQYQITNPYATDIFMMTVSPIIVFVSSVTGVAAFVLAIAVSYSLLKGERKKKMFRLILISVFLFAASNLISDTFLVFYNSVSLITQSGTFFDLNSGLYVNLPYRLINLAIDFSLLTIGLLLKERSMKMEEKFI
jgi:hypothetical protein